MSAFPTIKDRPSLEAWLNHPVKPLSERATAGFLSRAEASDLRFPPRFLAAVRKHLQSVRGARGSA
jgi:DNA (cytosine-5)-methyltransferase 1